MKINQFYDDIMFRFIFLKRIILDIKFYTSIYIRKPQI